MITVEQLRALKKGNFTVDPEKTKERIPEAFKSATKEQKDALSEMTGFAYNAFYGVARTGVASPKTVLAMSQVLDISPYYLTGEIDEKKSCDAVELAEFFNKCGVSKSAKSAKTAKVKAEKPAKAAKVGRPAKTEKSVKVKAEKPVKIKAEKPAKLPKSVELPKPVPAKKRASVSDEDTVVLLKALSLRAKIYGGEAEATYRKVVSLLTQ